VEEDGSPIGYTCVRREDDHDFIEEIALLPDAQGRGIGSKLIRDVIASAGARGVCVRLSVRTNNRARRLYERLGFPVSRIEEPRVKMEWRPPLSSAAAAPQGRRRMRAPEPER